MASRTNKHTFKQQAVSHKYKYTQIQTTGCFLVVELALAANGMIGIIVGVASGALPLVQVFILFYFILWSMIGIIVGVASGALPLVQAFSFF